MKDVIVKALESLLEKVKSDSCELTEAEMLQALDLLEKANKDRGMSKEEACRYLNISRSTFDTYIRNGWIPKGEKRLGFKELSWLESDLDIACEKIRKMLINDKIGD